MPEKPIKVEVTWDTGHEADEILNELDEDSEPATYQFATAGEAAAFVQGVNEAMDFANGWLDASASTRIVKPLGA